MVIEIADPVFKCSEDETIFFGRLSALNGYESLVRQDRTLVLRLADEFRPECVEALGNICDFWNLSYKVIEG